MNEEENNQRPANNSTKKAYSCQQKYMVVKL